VIGIPTSFEVEGEQYIAVTAGWGLDAQDVQNGIDKIQGTKTAVPKGGTVLVFKLRFDRRWDVSPSILSRSCLPAKALQMPLRDLEERSRSW
jgi:hypothetical protein